MQANPRTLDVLFNSQLRYVVPMFQRLYVWQEEPQWKTLWEDVVEKAALQLKNAKSNAHYLGALIIEGVRPSSPREVKRFLVIDGQQRLTTLQLLFCAYRDLAKSREWKTLDRATARYLENADIDVMEHPEEERFKLWPTALNRSVFAGLITAGTRAAVEERFPLTWLPRRRKPEPRSQLVEAYLFFYSKIEEWVSEAGKEKTSDGSIKQIKTEEECAFALLQALQQDFCVVEIALSEGDDSQEIFYSLNSQGRPLSQSDLLRSLVFMRAEKEKQNRDEIFDQYWSKFETPYWSTEIKRAGRTYSRLDLGLRFFLTAKKGEVVDARRVNEEYRAWITGPNTGYASVRAELADFARFADLYKTYDEATTELPCVDLKRVVRDFDVSTVIPLLLFLQLDSGLELTQLRECEGIIESFIVRRAITGEETKEYNKLFVEVIGTLKGVASSEIESTLLRQFLEGGGVTRSWPTDTQVIEAILSRPIDSLRTPALRLILERLELAERTKKTETEAIASNLQIEHVMPQKWYAHWPLQGRNIPEQTALYPTLADDELKPLAEAIRSRNSKIHVLGNLTLLNHYLNPAASNGAWELKLHEYQHSVLRLNRYFHTLDHWDEETIGYRSKDLAERVCRIWPRPSSMA